ncbi:hypothetical protein [Mucilaginibacter sp. SP1R1]|uniref:hypothetical protein n=1 Tax=Mucilaginibacter sp. SP1R1 TaxID=2723091 RepID=UPI0016117DC8|nr:hypothetical protein [Mucilaginibacter sp. SP1R1]MBB6148482.1 hypothetical protein [Mucilaginibacter sp. SP1R1]
MIKTLLITTLVLATAWKANAQPNMLGKTRDYIKASSYLPGSIGSFDKEDLVNDSTTFLQLVDRENKNVHFRYYLTKGICDYYVIMQPKSDMARWVETLNSTYTKTNTTEWVSKEMDMKISILYLDDADVFTTGFSSLK